jgi:hypothetical protein
MQRFHHVKALLAVSALTLGAAGCGSGGLDSTSTTPANDSAVGIWSGTDSASGLTLEAFIDEAGQADFIRGDGVQYVGTVQVSGDTLVVSVDGYTDFGASFSSGGATYGIGTVNGTVSTGGAISATLSFTPTGGSEESSTWSLTFDSTRSNTASSLGAVAGTYTSGAAFIGGTDPLSSAAVTISSSGVISAQSSASGCVLNGSVTVSDSSFDIYLIAYMLSSCTGTYAVLNGVQLTGLAVLDTTVAPNQLVIGVTGQAANDGAYYGLVTALTAS